MNKKFLKGGIYSACGSLWWGIFGVLYFNYFSYVGAIELVVHRIIWTVVVLVITTTLFSKWKIFSLVFSNKKNILYLFITSLLITANWSIWIYALSTNRNIDASLGYFIFPIISIFFGYIFFQEKLNNKRIISILLVISSIIYLLVSFKNIPWIGLSVALVWSLYNLIRKKINIETDIGLLIESLFAFPFAILVFYFLFLNNVNDFIFDNISLIPLLRLAGPMTVIPLFLYVKGVEFSNLGTTGMIFFITPTCQFLLGFFYYNEPFSINKFVGFILIWIAVIIYLKDIYQNKK